LLKVIPKEAKIREENLTAAGYITDFVPACIVPHSWASLN
jgi:hypothetical protein